jgi:hypothetical protein
MPQDRVDLRPGAVLHIKGFASRGHPPKNKYILIIGCLTESEVLGFLISSKLDYLNSDVHRPEVVRIPDRAVSFLRVESIIQCFALEFLSREQLCAGYEEGNVSNEGRLPIKYLYKIREVVKESRLLAQVDIDRALRVLPPAD